MVVESTQEHLRGGAAGGSRIAAVPDEEQALDPIAEDRFEELVSDALDGIPDALWERVDNVAVVVEDRHADDPELLGLYEGIPLTERGDGYFGVLPDRISIYRLALCDLCEDEDDLVEEIRITVVHEIAHHMGIDDDELHELGWA